MFLKRHEHSTHSTRCRLLMPGLRFDDKLSLELTMPPTVPPGRGLSASLPGTSCLALQFGHLQCGRPAYLGFAELKRVRRDALLTVDLSKPSRLGPSGPGPGGTKTIRPSKRLALSQRLWAETQG